MNFSLFHDKTCFLSGGKNAPQKPSNTEESGRSLIEMLGTIAIITMITVGGMTGAAVGMQTWRANNAADDVEQAILGVQDLYSWQKDYAGLSMNKICENDVISRKCEGDHWSNPFGGIMTINQHAGDGFMNFEVKLTNVPAAACRSLVSRSWDHVGTVQVSGGSCPEGRQGTRDLTFIPF